MSRLLALIPYVPYPTFGGGEQRLQHVMQTLSRISDLVVAALPRENDQAAAWPLASQFAESPQFFQRDRVLTASAARGSLKQKFMEATTCWPRRIQNDQSESLWAYLDALDLNRFDRVHIESLSMAPYGVALKMRWPHIRLTLDVDNIDAVYAWQELRALRPWWLSREFYWRMMSIRRLILFARQWLPAFDAVWVCSETDRQWIIRRTRQQVVPVVPNGMDCSAFAGVSPALDRPRLVMAGTMMEGPNSDGAVWFAKSVWPQIRAAIPIAEFICVGRDPCPDVRALANIAGVTVTGSVPDVRPYLSSAALSIVPIRFGTGTRLKILEAMAAGLPVISTRIGADGLAFEPGRDLILADKAEEFAQACVELLQDEPRRHAMAAQGRIAVQKYDWSAIDQTIREWMTGKAVGNG